MTKYMPFFLDSEGFCTNQKCFILTGENLAYLTAFFNSNVFKISYRESFPELQGGTRELSKIFFEKLKIPRPESLPPMDFDFLVQEIQNGSEGMGQSLEIALLRALDLHEHEEYILSYRT